MDKIKLFFKKIFDFVLRYPVAIVVTIFLVIVTLLFFVFRSRFQIGGILEKLWGTEKKENLRLIPPEDRKDEKGIQIQPGKSDEKGFVQAPVNVEIKEPGIFSNPNKITIVHPEKGEVVLELPTGVKNRDIKQIVEVSPNVYQVANNDKGVDAGKLLEELEK